MFSFRKWIAAKIAPGSSSEGQNDARRSDSSSNGTSSSRPIGASPFHLRLLDQIERELEELNLIAASGLSNSNIPIGNQANHSLSAPQKSNNGATKKFSAASDLTVLRFYQADAQLNEITAELDSFEGKNEPVRCANLVNRLRCAQDKVICLLFQMMDECECKRVSRDYRLKFPDDLVVGGENGESLNGQIWFGAECLASGSNIMNHEAESESLRPLAKLLTQSMQQIRTEIRYRLLNIHSLAINNQPSRIIEAMADKLEPFDALFAHFEFEYVRAMLPIKTADEIERLHELTVLFSEAVARSLKKGLISQEDIDECHPHVLIAIPRLAIIYGLVHCQESPILRTSKDGRQSHIFRPYYSLLCRARDLISALRPIEVQVLERMLTNEENVNLFHGNSETATSFTPGQEDEVAKANCHKKGHPDCTQASTSSHKQLNSSRSIEGNRKKDPSHVSPPICVVVDASDEYNTQDNGNSDGVKHFNLSIVNARSTGSTPSTSMGSCKTDDSTSYSLSTSTSTAASGSQRRGSPFYRRRRHSDPLQILSATLARKSAYQEITSFGRLKDAPSTWSLVTTLKEKQNRLTRMSFCAEDPKLDRRQSPASSSSCPVAHTCTVSTNLPIHSSRRSTIHPSRSFAADSHVNHEFISYGGSKSSRGATLPATRGRAHTLESTRSPPCSNNTNSLNNNNNHNNNNNVNPPYPRKAMSSVSLDSNTSTDSVDSFELALAVAAKSGCWISPGTRHLLHRLFVKIAGVADQLQSNHATDLRMILRSVFKMHSTVEATGEDGETGEVKAESSDSSDDVSVEEALEAREESSQTSSAAVVSAISSSSSSSSIVNKSQTYDFSPDETFASSSNVRLQVSPIAESSSNNFNSVIHLDRGTVASPNMPSLVHHTRTNPLPHQEPGQTGPRITSNPYNHNCSRFVGEPYMPLSSSAASSQASSPLSNSSLDTPQRHRRQIQSVMNSHHLSLIPPHHPNHHHQRNRHLVQQQQQQILSAHGRSSLQPFPSHHHHHHHHHHHQPAQSFVPISHHSNSDPMIFGRRRAHSESGDGSDSLTHSTPQNHWVTSSHLDQHQLSHASSGSVPFDQSFVAPIWVPDELVDSCTSCMQSFNLIRRRHHCRNCGQIYCNNCSSNFVPLSQFGYHKPVRVCDECFIFLANPLNLAPAHSSPSQPGQAEQVNCCHHLIHCYPHESLPPPPSQPPSSQQNAHIDPLYDRTTLAIAHGSHHSSHVPSSLSSTSTLTNYPTPSPSIGSSVAFNSTSSQRIV